MPLALAAGDDPELSIVDLPGLNPDMATLRRSLAQWRGHLEQVLADRYDIRLLALLIPTTQVVFCREAFTGLQDLKGRRIRVGAVAQGDLLTAVGAIPVVLPLAEVVAGIRGHTIDCAVTGSMPGNQIGLHRVTSHVSTLPLNWFVSAVAMNGAIWRSLPEDIRAALAEGLARLEQAVLDGAEAAIDDGFACDAGLPRCTGGSRGHDGGGPRTLGRGAPPPAAGDGAAAALAAPLRRRLRRRLEPRRRARPRDPGAALEASALARLEAVHLADDPPALARCGSAPGSR